MKNMEDDSDESTKTTKEHVKSTVNKSASGKSAKYKSLAMLQDADEEMEHGNELIDWPESPITQIR
jgi:hypothetical protein